MGEKSVCNRCGFDASLIGVQCECGACYCGFNCLVKSLYEVGIKQHTFDELAHCGNCAEEKLKSGTLTFPQGDKHLDKMLAPHLLLHVLDSVKVVKRQKKVSKDQLSLF